MTLRSISAEEAFASESAPSKASLDLRHEIRTTHAIGLLHWRLVAFAEG